MEKLEKLKPYSNYKDSGVEQLGQIPVSWEARKLKGLARIKNGSDHKSHEVFSENEGYPVYGSGGVFARSSEYLFDGTSVLLGRKGTLDKPLLVEGKFWAVDTTFYTEINEKICLPRLFYLFCTTIKFDYISSSTALPSMTQKDLKNWSFALPPLETQQRIVAFLDAETARIDNLVSELLSMIALLRENRKVLISNTVTRGIAGEHTKYKDSGVEWLGEIPSGWVKGKMGKIATWWNGYGFKPDDLGVVGMPVVRIRELIQEDIELDCTLIGNIPEENYLHTGDLIFSWSMTLLSKFWNRGDAILNQHLYKVVPKQDINITWIHYLLTGNLKHLENEMHGSAAKHLTKKDLLKFIVFIPPLSEQARIAEFLELETAKIDTLIAETTNAISLLKEERKALISDIVTGKLEV